MTWLQISRRTLIAFSVGVVVILTTAAVITMVAHQEIWLLGALVLVSAAISLVLAKSIHNALRQNAESLAVVSSAFGGGNWSDQSRQGPPLLYAAGEPLDLLRRDIQRDTSALLSLHATVSALGSIPAPGGWAATPETLLALVSRIQGAPTLHTVVECGSGTSTIWMALALRERGSGRLVSLEHDQHYADTTTRKLEDLGLSEWVDIRVSPLVHQIIGERTVLWFPPSVLDGIENVSLLFVDGPPAFLGSEIRFPALPQLEEKLTDDAWVILDDIDREEEKSILEQWLARGNGRLRLRSQTDRAAILEKSN